MILITFHQNIFYIDWHFLLLFREQTQSVSAANEGEEGEMEEDEDEESIMTIDGIEGGYV